VTTTASPPPNELRPIGTSRPAASATRQLAEVWNHRSLLLTLAGRDVKSRHRNSLLGFTWNLLNPLLQMVIYTVVFTYFMPGGTPMFPLKLLTGTAIFSLFTTGVTNGTTSVTGNTALVSKIWFPREVLPVAAIVSNLVTFASRISILVVAMIIYRHPPAWSLLWLAVCAVLVTMVLATGAAVLLSALNVYFRDVQHFLDLILLALFWFTPIIWSYGFVANELINRFGPRWERLAMLNPLTPVVTVFERVLYNPAALPPDGQHQFELILRPTSWHLQNLGYSLVVGLVLLYIGLRVFSRLEGSFVENL